VWEGAFLKARDQDISEEEKEDEEEEEIRVMNECTIEG